MLPDMSATSRRALGLLLFIGSFGGSLGADCFPASSAIDGGYVLVGDQTFDHTRIRVFSRTTGEEQASIPTTNGAPSALLAIAP